MKLPKVYEASQYEDRIYKLWEDSGAFQPTGKGTPFSIVLPPPNTTGKLHVGHAAMLAIEDTIVRYRRMMGDDVLWVPGTDHAAIATNAVIERQLTAEGTSKHKIGRAKFLERVHEYVGESQGNIRTQVRAMGASLDWTRERYTMEPAMNRIVGEVFVKMYNDGLIYRGQRIVNWDRILQTTVSDDEVKYHEEVTTFYTLKYGPFEIGTARPETKFGDKYVVMHPDDKRYAQYEHNQKIEVEWINGVITATIIKDTAVDPKFGTGVMTITPWHDATDFEIAQRHKLDSQQIIDLQGRLLPIAGELKGMDIAEARNEVVQRLKKKGLVVKEDPKYRHNVAISDRGGAVIEPQIMEQWFIDVNKPVVHWNGNKLSLKEVMQSVVREGSIKILPARFDKIYFNWVDNLRDWCISRQIWWGHRIPAWYRLKKEGGHEVKVGYTKPEGEGWEQDPDTLDTWFSAALWSWSTLLDPKVAQNESISLENVLKKSSDYKRYHPTDLLETGYDIIFFWVARMILMTTYITGEVPFRTVYLHGLVRTKDGNKMSKSNPKDIIDPLDVIPKYGTDALRLSLLVGQTPGNDMRIYDEKIASYRNFCNKLWNIARYVESKVDGATMPEKLNPLYTADHWILTRLHQTTVEVEQAMASYEIGKAYEKLYHFVWDDFADWYVEVSKQQFNGGVLAYVLETVLKLTHPFAPFVTETIWDTLEWERQLLIEADWPTVKPGKALEALHFSEIIKIVKEIRNIRTMLQMNRNRLYHKSSDFLEENKGLLMSLTGLIDVKKVSSGKGLHLTTTSEECWIDIDEFKARDYMLKLIEKRDGYQKSIVNLEKRLQNESYLKKAPKELVQQTEDQLASERALLERLELEVENFERALKRT